MIRNLLIIISLLFLTSVAIGQTAVAGKVIDVDTKEELFGANLVFKKNGNFVTGASTDLYGNYKVNVDPGTYDVTASYIGLSDVQITGVVVKDGQTTDLPIDMGGDGGITIDVVVVKAYTVPLIDKDNTTSGGTITSKEIRNLPTKNISALASTTAGLSQVDEGGDVTVRGSRSDATDYYVDGIRVSGSLIPESEIEQMKVITGGIGAKYGDVTGGIISITTKGPSAEFGGSVEVETSEYLDQFGYNLVSANFSGPILKNKETDRSILGYRFSGRYRYQKDDDPPATDIYTVKEDRLQFLQENPISIIDGGTTPTAQTFTTADMDILGYQPNEEVARIDLTGKLDAQLTDNIDITLTGTYADTKDKFTPGDPNGNGRAYWQAFNSHNNPTDHLTRMRGNFRFRHRLGNQSAGTEEDKAEKSSLIQNAFYTLQFGYEKTLRDIEDTRHGDDYFAYGYVGKFNFDYLPSVTMTDDPGGVGTTFPSTNLFGHTDYTRVFTGYDADETYNPVLARYNSNVVDPMSVDGYSARNGFFTGGVQGIWQQMHSNVGQVYNLNRKNDSDLFTFTASSSFDLVTGKSDNSRHSIEVGFWYEQRFNRQFDINPRGLWVLANQRANEHILGVDFATDAGIVDFGNAVTVIPRDLLLGDVTLHGLDIDENVNSTFYKKVREANGVGINEYINVDGLTPDQLSLDMFTARSLMDGYVDYYGYDYLGNKLGNNVTFDDFFTSEGADGLRDFPVAAFQPNYFAGYIQDKFTFNDITFRVGVRVDRYDANTKVLKDIYSLYEVMNASDFYGTVIPADQRPGAVGDNFKVYVEGDSDKVQAFRDGDQWYDATGTAVDNPQLTIFNSSVATPKLIAENPDIQSEDFNPNISFEDYKPQVNVMPRLAFSFPISDEANFFAHYDILVQRPPSNNIATAQDYFFFEQRQPRNNPNLKPEKTIDYEVGFNQKISNTSVIKMAIYYKELRDMIQSRLIQLVADVTSYESFDNIDFGTVKGFTFQYDLRRTGNVSANLNYTLQFADGTGSDPQSNRALNRTTNIRTLIPLNFDERHRFTASVDYRYQRGQGPELFGKKILSDFGINLQAITVSGRPYSLRKTPNRFGSTELIGTINGARKPWTFTLNLRMDKSFTLSKSEKFPLDMNVYFRVSNLLNTKNVVNLYSASGSAETDGFLVSEEGINGLRTIPESQLDSYLSSYQWAESNPDFFTLPRRMFIGAIFDF